MTNVKFKLSCCCIFQWNYNDVFRYLSDDGWRDFLSTIGHLFISKDGLF